MLGVGSAAKTQKLWRRINPLIMFRDIMSPTEATQTCHDVLDSVVAAEARKTQWQVAYAENDDYWMRFRWYNNLEAWPLV